MAQAGERIGAYEVVRLIARGGMATVYEARQPALDRAVALKRLDLRTDDPTLAERFIRESRIAASFDHPNIVTVYDFFEWRGGAVHRDGVPAARLAAAVRGPPQPAAGVRRDRGRARRPRARGAARDRPPRPQAGERAGHHARGAVKIADFGIAKAYTTATGSFTATGVAVGTPAYMAPEQALGAARGPVHRPLRGRRDGLRDARRRAAVRRRRSRRWRSCTGT